MTTEERIGAPPRIDVGAADAASWTDAQIEAARSILRAATLHPHMYLSENDIPADERLPPELDPVALSAQHLRRSREELTSDHVRTIAALYTSVELALHAALEVLAQQPISPRVG